MKLNLPPFEFNIREDSGKRQIFDSIRKRFVALTPEEWVRQHIVRLLIENFGVPAGLVGVEKSVKVGVLSHRCDAVIYDREGKPLLIVEVKAPSVPINQAVIDQASRYNLTLGVEYLLLSNGLDHLVLRLNSPRNGYLVLDKMLSYSDLIKQR